MNKKFISSNCLTAQLHLKLEMMNIKFTETKLNIEKRHSLNQKIRGKIILSADDADIIQKQFPQRKALSTCCAPVVPDSNIWPDDPQNHKQSCLYNLNDQNLNI